MIGKPVSASPVAKAYDDETMGCAVVACRYAINNEFGQAVPGFLPFKAWRYCIPPSCMHARAPAPTTPPPPLQSVEVHPSFAPVRPGAYPLEEIRPWLWLCTRWPCSWSCAARTGQSVEACLPLCVDARAPAPPSKRGGIRMYLQASFPCTRCLPLSQRKRPCYGYSRERTAGCVFGSGTGWGGDQWGF